MEEGLYDSVQYHAGFRGYGPEGQHLHSIMPNTRHYACSNPMEYFAELSVAFLSSPAPSPPGNEEDTNSNGNNPAMETTNEIEEYNKWFPHNRTQLEEHDPRAFKLLQQLWGVGV